MQLKRSFQRGLSKSCSRLPRQLALALRPDATYQTAKQTCCRIANRRDLNFAIIYLPPVDVESFKIMELSYRETQRGLQSYS